MRGGWSEFGMGKMRFHQFLFKFWWEPINSLDPNYETKFCSLFTKKNYWMYGLLKISRKRISHSFKQWMTEVFVEQPWLHRVFKLSIGIHNTTCAVFSDVRCPSKIIWFSQELAKKILQFLSKINHLAFRVLAFLSTCIGFAGGAI